MGPKSAKINAWIIFAPILAATGLAVILTRITDSVDPANVKETNIKIGQIGEALKQYQIDCKRLPTEDEGLAFLAGRDPNCPNSKEMYLKKMHVLDAWGNHFVYKVLSDGKSFELVSFGRDGKICGEDYNKDIVYSSVSSQVESR